MRHFLKTIRRALALLVIAAFTWKAYPVSYYYDDAGRVTQIAYESGSGVAYAYDDNDNILSVKTIFVPPQPPALTTSVTPNVGITLKWSAIAGSSSYRIYRRSDRNSNWAVLATVSSETFAFFDTSALAAVDYSYRLVAVGSEGLSAYSASTPSLGLDGVAAFIRLASDEGSGTVYSIVFNAEVEGVYRLDGSESLGDASWTPQNYALSLGGSVTTAVIRDQAGEIELFVSVPAGQSPRFFRLSRIFE